MTARASADVGDASGRHETVVSTRAARRFYPLAFVAWLAFSGLLVYAVVIGGGYSGIDSVTLRTVSLAIIATVLAGWGLLAWRVPTWRPGTAVWPALVIPVASLVMSTLLSEHPRLGVEYIAWSVLLVGLYLLLVRILRTEFARARIGGLAFILGVTISLLYLALVLGQWLDWWSVLGRVAVPPLRPGLFGLPFGGPNVVASAVVLANVVAFAGVGLATPGRRLALGLMVTLSIVVLIISGSRSAWLATGGAMIVAGGIWLVAANHSAGRRLGDRRTWAVLAASLVGLVALGPTVLDRLINGGDGGRPSYWASAIRMFQDASAIGLGPGSYAARRVAYLEPGDLDYTVPHAHNVYIQTAAELGVVGLAAGIIAGLAILWLIYRALRSTDSTRYTWACAALFGMVYLAIVDVADFYANLPGVLVLWLIPVAILDGAHDHGLGIPARLRPAVAGKVATAALGLGCLASVAVLVWAESTAAISAQATQDVNEGDWDSAAVAAARAVSADESHPGHQLTFALAAMHQENWESARQAYLRFVSVDDLPQAWLGLALATINSDGPDSETESYLVAAMRMGYQHPAVSYAAGELYDRIGHTAEANAAYADALVQLPELGSDPAWREDPKLAGRFDEILGSAIDRLGSSGWMLALAAGEADRARAIADAASPSSVDESWVDDVISAWQGDTDALGRVQAVAEADPTNSGPLLTAGWLTAHAGDANGANRYRHLAQTTMEGVSTLGIGVRSAPSCTDGQRIPLSTELYGRWAHRRPTPHDLMPPGLRCLILQDRAAGLG